MIDRHTDVYWYFSVRHSRSCFAMQNKKEIYSPIRLSQIWAVSQFIFYTLIYFDWSGHVCLCLSSCFDSRRSICNYREVYLFIIPNKDSFPKDVAVLQYEIMRDVVGVISS